MSKEKYLVTYVEQVVLTSTSYPRYELNFFMLNTYKEVEEYYNNLKNATMISSIRVFELGKEIKV